MGMLRVVTRCYMLLYLYRGKVCLSTFQVPISYSFPTHEYLVTYFYLVCYEFLRLAICCYLFIGERFVKLVSRFPFHIGFQPTNTMLHMFIGLVTCCYVLLNIYRGKGCQNSFQFPISYSFPTHQYLVAYVHWACYVLLRVVTCCYLLLHS